MAIHKPQTLSAMEGSCQIIPAKPIPGIAAIFFHSFLIFDHWLVDAVVDQYSMAS